MTEQAPTAYDTAAQETVEVGNRLAEADQEADPWEISDGLISGAVHYWLYARQPCDDPRCTNCVEVSTSEERLAALLRLVEACARDSDYFHSPNDRNVGRA